MQNKNSKTQALLVVGELVTFGQEATYLLPWILFQNDSRVEMGCTAVGVKLYVCSPGHHLNQDTHSVAVQLRGFCKPCREMLRVLPTLDPSLSTLRQGLWREP